MEKIERTFVHEKTTRRTYRFKEIGTEPLAIGTLYVQKTSFPEQPRKVKVTVEVLE